MPSHLSEVPRPESLGKVKAEERSGKGFYCLLL